METKYNYMIKDIEIYWGYSREYGSRDTSVTPLLVKCLGFSGHLGEKRTCSSGPRSTSTGSDLRLRALLRYWLSTVI